MTLPIERFKDAYSNWRYNPFITADMAVDASEDGLIIPAGSPFIIQLLEQPRYNDPTSVSVRCYGVKTDVDEESLSGQKVLKVAATAGFSPGDNIIIDRGGAREEEKIIDTIQGGVSLTVTLNLEYTHTAVQEDDVEKYIAFAETAGAPAQSQFRVDYPPDDGEGTGLIEFNQNDADKEVRVNYKATGSPALAETLDTKISYPAGTPDNNQVVGFSSGVPYWLRLPHANLASVTADQHHPQSHTHASHSGIGANDHHPQAHTLASHSTKPHNALTGIGVNDHHPQVHALGSHSDFATYLDQAVKQASNPLFANVQVNGLRLNDTGADHYLGLWCNENLSGNKTLAIIVGNASRNVTLSGNPTLGDWFNQNVKTTSTPSFQHLNLTNVASKLQGGARLNIEAGASGICSTTIFQDETVSAADLHIEGSSPYQIKHSTSSKRFKDKIKDLEIDSSLIHKLRPVSFNSKCKGDDKKKRFIGLIAEEIEQYYPEIINYNENKEVGSYDNQMLVTLLLAEMQNLNKRIKELKN